eukprot:5098011-Pyramimonas_sp.AAC.1
MSTRSAGLQPTYVGSSGGQSWIGLTCAPLGLSVSDFGATHATKWAYRGGRADGDRAVTAD